MTTTELTKLGVAVAVDQKDVADVASKWLSEQGLIQRVISVEPKDPGYAPGCAEGGLSRRRTPGSRWPRPPLGVSVSS